jgi:hypothetical protein
MSKENYRRLGNYSRGGCKESGFGSEGTLKLHQPQ